jgi:hypothetical protein
MFLQISCSVISVRRANPDIEGKSTSVNMRSMLCGLPFSISHAFKPSGTAATVETVIKTFSIPRGRCLTMSGFEQNSAYQISVLKQETIVVLMTINRARPSVVITVFVHTLEPFTIPRPARGVSGSVGLNSSETLINWIKISLTSHNM